MSKESIKKRREAFAKHLGSRDSLQIVIRGHLYIEAELVDLISDSVAMVRPEAIDFDSWSFPRKLEMAEALGLIESKNIGAFRSLNSLRNKLAHDLELEVSDAHVRDLYNSFSDLFKHLYGKPPTSSRKHKDALRQCIMVMWVHLNVIRQRQEELKGQWRQVRKEVAELRHTQKLRSTCNGF
jgi:hypothetical protein